MSEIKRFGVVSVAKVFAAINLVIGLIVGIIFVLFGSLFAIMVPEISQHAALGMGVGIVIIICFAIGSAIIGFIYGAIVALLYNLAAGWFGGVEVEVN